MNTYKPNNYNSLSAYIIANNAAQLVALLTTLFNATILRKYLHPNGTIAHIELLIDDTVLMLSNSTQNYPANTTMLHLYVPNVHATFALALQNGCTEVEPPTNQPNDPDTRGAFLDFEGNYWAISTQK